MTRCITLIISAALILTLFTACSNGQPRTSNSQSDVESQQSGTSGDQSEAPTVDAKALEKELSSASLGGVSFTANTSVGASGTLNADGTPLTLTYTDGMYNWKFDFPADALRSKTEIKIIAMKDIKSDALGNVPCGAVLEPDGLNFTVPVTVTVSGGNLGAKAFMLTGKSDGTDMTPTICADDNGTLTAKIFHFSGLAVTDNSSNDALMKKLTEGYKTAYKKLLNMAKSLLKQPFQIPEPPDISLRCVPGTHSTDYSATEPYLDQFLSPEVGILLLLGGALTVLKATDPDFITDKDMKIVGEIGKRLIVKGEELIKRYSPAQEKYVACAKAFQLASNFITNYNWLFNVSNEAKPDSTSIINYAQAVSKSLLKDLTEKHDYTAIGAIRRVMQMDEYNPYTEAHFRWDNPWNDFYDTCEENLLKALTFTVETECSVKYPVGFQGSSKASVKITPVLNPEGFYWKGVGNGHREMSWDDNTLLSPGDYTFTANVRQFDPCTNGTMEVVIDRFCPDTELLQSPYGHVFTLDPSLIKVNTFGCFLENVNLFDGDPTTNNYKMIFTLDITNLSATVADKTIESDFQGRAVKMRVMGYSHSRIDAEDS
jgi:hypothetical protein